MVAKQEYKDGYKDMEEEMRITAQKIFYMNQTAQSLKYISRIKTVQQMIEARAFFLAENNGMEF